MLGLDGMVKGVIHKVIAPTLVDIYAPISTKVVDEADVTYGTNATYVDVPATIANVEGNAAGVDLTAWGPMDAESLLMTVPLWTHIEEQAQVIEVMRNGEFILTAERRKFRVTRANECGDHIECRLEPK